MADTLTAKVKAAFEATFSNTLSESAGATSFASASALTFALSFADGTTVDKADKYWQSLNRSLASAGSESIDLYDLGSIDIGAGAGKDPLGQSVAFAEICAIIIRSRSTSVGNILVGNSAAATAFNSIWNAADSDAAGIIIKPNGVFLIATTADAAYAVADSSNHLLLLTASGGAVTYDIGVIGRSA